MTHPITQQVASDLYKELEKERMKKINESDVLDLPQVARYEVILLRSLIDRGLKIIPR